MTVLLGAGICVLGGGLGAGAVGVDAEGVGVLVEVREIGVG